ncbi:hypothetical protein AGMMS50230_06560 [Spirochaetia bacterium]|nr:hypothetical protein AGMMS50230_06560 [Spirochaetia bacterium]
MEKIAIIYYSFEGNCTLVGKILQELFSGSGKTADIFAIKTLDTKKRTGFSKYVWGGSQVFMHKKPVIQPLAFDAASYSLIILGAPVWAASPAPAMASFLDTAKITGKRIALFCCHAGGPGKALEKFRTLLPGNTFAGELDIFSPAKDPEALTAKLKAWAETLVQ